MSGTDWPVELRGITETVVATPGPDGRWNLAALGLFAGDPVVARTWGRTRTRRNFRERGEGYVQFTPDPVDFVEAACTVRTEPDPILDSACAWVAVDADAVERGTDDGTSWVEWALSPTDAAVERRVVPTANRGYYAVLEASIAASRLDVPGYDAAALRDRLAYFRDVVERCGGDRERRALAVVLDSIEE